MPKGKSLEEKRAEIDKERAELDRQIEQRNLLALLRSGLSLAKKFVRDKEWSGVADAAMGIRSCAERLAQLEDGFVAEPAADVTLEEPER